MALKTPDDLDAARELIATHANRSPMADSPSWRIVVSPSKGMVHRLDLDAGSAVTEGAPVATVQGRREEHRVTAVHDGTVVEWLVEEGDPVSPGQPLLRLVPAAQPAGAQ